jgi:prophage maintenance system killer protein
MTPLPPSQLLYLHARLATTLGVPAGVADLAALRAALATAAAADGDLFEQAAALADALARGRPFRAANLAGAAAAAGLFLRAYDLDLQLAAADAPTLRALLTAGDPAALTAWLRAHTVPRPLD